jgi:hypothetical protein
MTPHYRLSFKVGRLFVVAAVMSAALAFPAISHAALLPVGGQFVPSAEPVPAGTTELATNTAPFAGIGFLGTVTSRVLTNDSSNPFGADRLTFTYQVTNAAESVHVLHRLTASDYTGFQTDVGFDGATGVSPSRVERTTADVVGFNFIETVGGGAGLITPGSSSRVMVIQTDATAFRTSFVSLINGGVSTVSSFAPVPEPGTWILASLGLLGLLGLVRRVRK